VDRGGRNDHGFPPDLFMRGAEPPVEASID
jgi:hypothetical protein